MVMDSKGNRNTSQAAAGGVVSIAIGGLVENTRYRYHVVATNELGSTESSNVEISECSYISKTCMHKFNSSLHPPSIIATGSVQDVSICQVTATNYSIQCIYLNGSEVDGCGYTLVGRTGNRTGYIERSNSEGVIVDLTDITEILAFANVTDAITVSKDIDIGSVEMCPPSITTTGRHNR